MVAGWDVTPPFFRRLGPIPPICYISTMALNIKDAETERLAAEVAALAGETKTRAVKIALRERKERLGRRIGERERGGGGRPKAPPDVPGKPLTRAEREEILGYGTEGV